MIFREYLNRAALSILLAGTCVFLNVPQLNGRASSTGKETKSLPRFEDYPVTEQWQGPASPVQLNSREERLFRTYLTEASKKKPDFAGHYRFVMWGCGTQCVGGALVDLGSGEVFQAPLAHKTSGEEHWIFCVNMDNAHHVNYRLNSRLFVLPCNEKVYYFVWENAQFRQIARLPAKAN